MNEDKLGTLEEAIEFDKKRNYQYTTPVAWMQTYKGEANNIAWTKKEFDEFGNKSDYEYFPLYTTPTIVKDEQGKVVAITLTNEEHQVQEVLWQAPREISGVEIIGMSGKYDFNYEVDIIDFARAILKKASEK